LGSVFPTDQFYPPGEAGAGGSSLASSLKGLNNLVNAPDAVHERRARSEDVGAVDLVDLSPLDRGDPLPAGSPRDRLGIDRLAAPRGEDNLGITLDDRIGFDLAPRGGLLVAQLGEHVTAPGDLDDVRHPVDSRDERVHPLLEVDARPVRPASRVLADLSHLVAQVTDQLPRLALAAEGAADQEDRAEDVVERALIGAEHRNTGADEIAHDLAL